MQGADLYASSLQVGVTCEQYILIRAVVASGTLSAGHKGISLNTISIAAVNIAALIGLDLI